MILRSYRITRLRELEANDDSDVARPQLGDVVLPDGMHPHESVDSLLLSLGDVVDGNTFLENSRVHSDKAQRARVRIDLDLEDECLQGAVGIVSDFFLLIGIPDVDDFEGRCVERGRKIIHDSVEKCLYSDVPERRTYEYGENRPLYRTLPDCLLHEGDGDLGSVEVELGDFIRVGCEAVDEAFPHFVVLICIIGRNFVFCYRGALVVGTEGEVFRVHEVDDALEFALASDGDEEGNGVCPELLLHFVEYPVEVRTESVHLVDEGDTGNIVGVCLAPYRLRLGLDSADSAEYSDSAVEDSEASFDFGREIDMAGSVDDVNLVLSPVACRGGTCYRDAPVLLLLHPVHRCFAVVDFAYAVVLSRVEEDSLRRGRLARVDMCHYSYVSYIPVVHGWKSSIKRCLLQFSP